MLLNVVENTKLPENYEKIQNEGSVYSRNHINSLRIKNNVKDFYKYLSLPVISIGCGDGYELECLMEFLNIRNPKEQLLGIDISEEKIKRCKKFGFPVLKCVDLDLLKIVPNEKKYDIYSAHTLEHTINIEKIINIYKKICKNTIIIIVPMENRTNNKAHYSPIHNLSQITKYFDKNWKITTICRYHLSYEGVVIAQRND